MRIGLVARADYTGLGIQTYDFYKHMNPSKVLMVDLSHLNGQSNNWDLYPGARVLRYTPYPDTNRSHPDAVAAINEFLDDLDLVFTCETPYDYHLFMEARRRNIRTVLQYNYELLDHVADPSLPRPDLFMAPSLWRYKDVPVANKVFCPVPVDRKRFVPQPRTEARTFVHVVGNPAMEDRNGTQSLLSAWSMTRSSALLRIYTQKGRYVRSNRRVEVVRGAVPDQHTFYMAGDVMIMPRKFGGLCLPLNEALSCAMPVVMTDLSPQNMFLNPESLIPARLDRYVMTKSPIGIHEPDIGSLAAKVDQLYNDPGLVQELSQHSDWLASKISWDALKPLYENIFQAVVAGDRPKQEFQW